jgi:preprotein translocase subunit SecY
MSIIFAMSMLQFPAQIAMFFPSAIDQPPNFMERVANILNFTHPVGAVLYVILIFVFTHFYISFTMNPQEMATNLKNQQATIPGIRSGAPTVEYLRERINRMAWIGAVFYSIIALVPILMQLAVPTMNVAFGGTTLLIVTGVALEFINKLDERRRTEGGRGYSRFLG